MDKVIEELLHPFVKRLATSAIGALVMFWAIGMALFHFFHPQPIWICRTGGTDLCGLFSGDAKRVAVALLCLLAAVVASSLAVFSRTAETAQFLSGANWRLLSHLGIRLQEGARRRATNRAHPNRVIAHDTPTTRRTTSRDGRGTWRRYPHGSPRLDHDDPRRLSDVALQPTLLGNVFAASQQRVMVDNGIGLDRCWYVLLVVLPQTELANLQAGTAALLSRTQTFVFCLATSAWAVWLPGWLKAPWILVWLVIAYGAYRGMCAAAGHYCAKMEGIISINRSLLYQKLDLPPLMPTITEQQRRAEQFGVYGPYTRIDPRMIPPHDEL
jgi:type II secretory pathway pseudopilin PulG